MDTQGFVLGTVAAGILMLKHQAISKNTAYYMLFVLDQFHTEILQL